MNTETSVKHMIVVKGLSKSFDDVPVLQNLDATLNKGEIVSSVGPSGTGKSTLSEPLGDSRRGNHIG